MITAGFSGEVVEFLIFAVLCFEAGRCALTPPDPLLQGAWFQTGTYQVKTRLQNVRCTLTPPDP
jgi:hypothetical protein